MNKKNIKTIIIIAVLIAGLFVVYTYFFAGSDNSGELVTSSSSTDLTVVDELFALLNDLSQLRIDTSLFERDSYQALKDYTVTLEEQPQGRVNPFRSIE